MLYEASGFLVYDACINGSIEYLMIYGERKEESSNMGESRFVSYSGKEKEIVRQGIDAIRCVLTGDDDYAKQSLLLCLDWFMDPYYGQDISDIRDELIDLLQEVVVSDNSQYVKEDALELLDLYVGGPFPILEANVQKVEEKLLPRVEYSINSYRIAQIEPVMLEECNRLYKENKSIFPDMADRYWVLYNRNLSYKDGKPNIEMEWLFDKGELIEGVPYRKSVFPHTNDKEFFLKPEIHFNILFKEEKALIAYYFGKRFARCLEYDLNYVDGKYSLSNMIDVWVS